MTVSEAKRFRRKALDVEAIQWVGEANCEEVFEWLGMEHPEDEMDHSVIYVGVWSDGVLELGGGRPDSPSVLELVEGCWLTRDSEGGVRAYADGTFRAEFEEEEE